MFGALCAKAAAFAPSFTFTEFVLACAFLFALGKFTWWLFWGAWYRKGE